MMQLQAIILNCDCCIMNVDMERIPVYNVCVCACVCVCSSADIYKLHQCEMGNARSRYLHLHKDLRSHHHHYNGSGQDWHGLVSCSVMFISLKIKW